jgi:putative hydrolase of HD superfamily
MDLTRLFEFTHLTHKLRNIQRDIDVHGGGRAENDMEHSYQLALVAWYLAQRDHPELDISRIIALALVHDLVEAYAGDISAYAPPEVLAGKAQSEAQAITQLAQDWPDFPALHELISEYENHTSPEAEFVYSLDKIVPILNNYTDNGRGWRQKHIGLAQVRAAKDHKADRSPAAAPYYRELIAELEKSPHLFGTKKEA